MKNNEKFLIHLCTILFFVLCLTHYFTQRPLWLDENFVYENILNHGYLDLFGPLKPVQSFPRVYLLAIKMFSMPFDLHVLALRFFSLLCMLGAFVLLVKIFRADSRNDFTAFLALFAICASFKFSYYAAELKPYSMDVLVVAIYAYYFHYQRIFETVKPSRKDYIIVSLLPLLVFFSYASLFVFWIIGLNFLLQLKNNRQLWRLFLLNVFIALVCFGLFYWVDIRHSVTAPGIDYWDGHFICYSSFECFWDKFGDGVRRMVIFPFEGIKPQRYAASLFIPFGMFALFIYGFKRLKRDKFQIYHSDSLALLLFVELFIVSSFQLYPFTGERLTLFFLPFISLMVVKGLTGLIKHPKWTVLAVCYFIIFYIICLGRTFYNYLEMF